MTEDDAAAAPSLQHQLALLQELEDGIRRQDRSQQAATAETSRLQLVIDAAVVRLQAMVAGQRASRAELQAVIADLRTAIGQADATDT
jgi:hypothetical protein